MPSEEAEHGDLMMKLLQMYGKYEESGKRAEQTDGRNEREQINGRKAR